MTEQQPRPAITATPKATAPAAARRSALVRRTLAVLVGLYGLATLAVWALIHFGGDRWWPTTVMLFGPRWVYAFPLPVLALLAAMKSRRLLWPLAALAVVHVGPIMGLQLHCRGGSPSGSVLRVMSCNVDGWVVDNKRLTDFIREVQPHVVLLQEYPHPNNLMEGGHKTPLAWPEGWQVVHYDEYLLATRLPLVEWQHFERPEGGGSISGVAYTLEWKGEKLRFFNLHLLSPRPGLEAVLDGKTVLRPSRAGKLVEMIKRRAKESEALREWVAESTLPTIVAGDFNMPPDSTIYRADWSRLSDAFSQSGLGFGYTKTMVKWGWKYGARIDHVLFDSSWRARRCWVGPDVDSDHLPLIAEFE